MFEQFVWVVLFLVMTFGAGYLGSTFFYILIAGWKEEIYSKREKRRMAAFILLCLVSIPLSTLVTNNLQISLLGGVVGVLMAVFHIGLRTYADNH